MKPLVKSSEGYRIAQQASRAFVGARIRQSYSKKQELAVRASELQKKLKDTMESEDLDNILGLCESAAEKTFLKTKKNHVSKLGSLIEKHRHSAVSLRPEGLERWVVNLSDRSLSKDEEEVLRLGLNFAPAPTKLPLIEMVAALEEGANKLRGEDANDLRGRLCGILRRAKLPRDNLTKDQRLALKKLREEKDVVILPADKGNSTVLMNSSGYVGGEIGHRGRPDCRSTCSMLEVNLLPVQ